MNAVSEATERVALYYREGSSDKVYQAAIEPAGSQFVVNFAYGRRGSTLTTGTKTSSPVDYTAARKIYTKLVGEKKAKGYTEGENGTPYQHADKQASGILPQLLNPVEEAEVELLLRDDNLCAQEKLDGKHLLVRKQDDDLEGINKKGFVVGLPQTVANELRSVAGSFIPDGESIGDNYHAFDLLVRKPVGRLDFDLGGKAAALLARGYLKNAVGIDEETHLDARHSRGHGRNAFQIESRQRTAVGSQFALTLHNVNCNIGLPIDAGGEVLGGRSGDGGVALDDARDCAAQSLNPERERRDIEQKHLFGGLRSSGQNVGLDCRAERDHLVGIQLDMRALAACR